MKLKTFIVDAFTNKPFKGNPAGVCLSNNPIDPKIMQAIASELNLSETAFLVSDEKDDTKFSVRYFTPSVEIAFCGHATLASAKLILDKFKKDSVNITTHHNLHITAIKVGKQIMMKFPLYDTIEYSPNPDLYKELGINKPINTRFAQELDMLLIEVADKKTLTNIKPDFSKLIQTSDTIKEVVVTAKSTERKYDFYSRCFCPWIGINEDPVTGASHSVLAKYWGNILGKSEMSAYQVSERGGYMDLKISNNFLEVTSDARIVFEGVIKL